MPGAWAASITNADTGGSLISGASWVGGVAPGSADIGIWDSTITAANPAFATSALGGSTGWSGIKILNPAVPIVISSGNTLTLGASGIDMSQATTNLTLNNTVALGANQSWVVTNGQTLAVNAVISGNFGLTLNGGGNTNGTIILNAANTYTNGTIINGGIINLLNTATPFGAAAGGVTNLGGTIILGVAAAGMTIPNPLTFSNTTVIDCNAQNASTGNNTWALPMSGNGTIIISNLEGVISTDTASVQTLTLGSGTAGQTMNNFSGKIIFAPLTSAGTPSGGNFRFNGNTATAPVNTGSPTASFNLGASPGTVALTSRNNGTINLGELTGGATTSLIASRSTAGTTTWSIGGMNTSTTFAGRVKEWSGLATAHTALTKVGTGTLTLTGTNLYTGVTTINGGFLNAGIAEDSGNAFGPFGEPATVTGSILFGGGGIQYSSVNQYDYSSRFDNGTLGNQPILIDVNGQSVSFNTALAGTGTSLTLTNSTGSGTLTLNNPETYTGPTIISSGKLVMASGSSLASGSPVSIGAGGTFDVSALGGTYTLGAALGANNGATAATIVPASGGIFNLNTQPLTLTWNGASSGTDNTHPSLTVTQGTLNFNNNKFTVVVPGSPLGVGVYKLISAAAITGTINPTPSFAGGSGVLFGDSGVVSISGNSVILTVASTSLLTQWTDVTGDTNWSTTGNWSNGVPSHAGDAAIFYSLGGSAVILNVPETVGGILFSNASSDVISGANILTLNNNANGAQIAVSAGTSNTISTAISLNDTLTATTSAGDSLALSGVVSNAAGVTNTVTVVGSGTNALSNANTYGPAAGTVGTTLVSGTLQAGNSSALGAGDVSVVSSSTLLSGAAGVNLPNNIILQPGLTFTVNNGGNTFTLGGVVSGSSANLVSAGSGTNSLNGVDTYGGTTTINAGSTLAIGGAGQLGGGIYSPAIVDNGVFNYNSSASQTNSGVISGSGRLLVGAGNLTLPTATANTYTGGSLINGGIVQAQNAASFGTGAITNNGGTILLLPAAALTFANNLWITGASILDQNNYNGSDIFNGTLGGSGILNITNLVSGATLTFGGAMSNFSGKIVIAPTNSTGNPSGGFLRFDSGTAVINTGSTNASFNLGASPSQAILCTRNPETANVGELTGGPGTAVEGCRNAGTTIWSIGALNTSTTFFGTIENEDGSENNAALFAGLTKVGTGTLTLAGQNTYTGPTTVSSGTLALVPLAGVDATISSSTNIVINTGATLSLSALATPTLALNAGQAQFFGGGGTLTGNLTASGGTALLPGGTTTAGTLTINGNLTETGGVTNQFSLATIGSSNDLINVNGNIDISSGMQTILLNGFGGGAVTNGTYPLFTYTGTLNGGTNNLVVFQLGTFPYVSTLTNNTAAKQIAVIITSARPATNLVWQGDGANNYWDTVSSNDWLSGTSPLVFESGDKIFFTDSGLVNSNVNIQGVSMFPSSVVVSNSTAVTYNFNGSGDISGTIGLTKTNTGTVIINNNNTYTGQTVFGGGTISVSSLPNGGLPGPIGAASNNPTNLLFVGGTLAYTGSGSTDHGMTFTTNSSGTINVANGASLTLSGLIVGTNTTFTKTGPGTLVMSSSNVFAGNIVINGGTLSDINAENYLAPVGGGLGNPQIAGRTVTINTNGILSLDSSGGNDLGNGSTTVALGFIINPGGLVQITAGNAVIGPVTLNGGTLDAPSGSGNSGQYGPYEFGGTITVGGSSPSTISGESSYAINLGVNAVVNRIFNVADVTGNSNADLIVTSAFNDSGNQGIAGIIKTGAGTMTMSGANTYSGPTIISNGVLQVTSTGSIGPGTNQATSVVNILGGTLAGSGTIYSSLTNGFGGTLAPGTGTNVPGTVLTVNSTVTLLPTSTTIMKVSHSANDQITVSGPVTYGGVLTVATNAGDATPYQVNQTFTLFNLQNGASGSFATIQPSPGPGLGWDSSSLTTSGQIKVIAATAPTSGFTGTPTTGSAPLPVTFANSSTAANYWTWNFGDGSTLTTNSNANLVHTYNTAGSYGVSLTAYGVGGSSLQTNTAYIIVTNLPPVPLFVGTPTNGAAPLAVTFTNTTTGVATNWLWSFGDGTTFNTVAATNISHIYTNAGIYNVSLTATGSGGTVALTNTAYITATNLVPVAIFSGSPTNIFALQSVTFTNSSTGNGLTNWIWNFGDGLSQTNQAGTNITHAYAVAGTNTVSLTVNGPGGSGTTTRTNYILVLPQPSIGTVALSGGKLVLSGTGGPVGQQYRILTSTNVASSLSGWTAVFTNTFTSPGGNYSYTNSAPTNGASFFILVSP